MNLYNNYMIKLFPNIHPLTVHYWALFQVSRLCDMTLEAARCWFLYTWWLCFGLDVIRHDFYRKTARKHEDASSIPETTWWCHDAGCYVVTIGQSNIAARCMWIQSKRWEDLAWAFDCVKYNFCRFWSHRRWFCGFGRQSRLESQFEAAFLFWIAVKSFNSFMLLIVVYCNCIQYIFMKSMNQCVYLHGDISNRLGEHLWDTNPVSRSMATFTVSFLTWCDFLQGWTGFNFR